MASEPSWLKGTDDEQAVQLPKIALSMTQEPFKTLLNISTTDAEVWNYHAQEFGFLQLQAIPNADAYKKALVAARDLLTHGPSRDYVRPSQNAPTPPTYPSGVTIFGDFYDWANVLVKQWKSHPDFTPALQEQMGLVVSSGGGTGTETPQVRSVKALSGGVLQIDVYKGSAAMVITQLNVDGSGWPVLEDGGKYQKTLASSRFEFKVPPGAAHSVEIRTAFADKGGNMQGDWSEVKTVSSLA